MNKIKDIIREYFDLPTSKAEANAAKAEALIEEYANQRVVELLKDYANRVWTCDVLHGGYNVDEKDVYKALKEYEKREDLRKDFAVFFEQAQLRNQDKGSSV